MFPLSTGKSFYSALEEDFQKKEKNFPATDPDAELTLGPARLLALHFEAVKV